MSYLLSVIRGDRVDFETVKFLGHQMRGSGSAFGFQAITDIGAAIRQAAESADTDASRKWVGELSSYLVDRIKRLVPLRFPQAVEMTHGRGDSFV
jgi:hypothetical protein